MAPIGSTTASPNPSSTGRGGGSDEDGHGGGGGGGGSGTNPSIFTFVVAIALFAVVVGFIILRLIYRRRTGRGFWGPSRSDAWETATDVSMGGPTGRGTNFGAGGASAGYRSATVTTDDPLKPPKLWDAKVADYDTLASLGYAHSSASGRDEKDSSKNAWDRIMPVAAALPPQLYPVLFADHDEKDTDQTIAATGKGEIRRRIKSFRNHGSGTATTEAANGTNGQEIHDGEADGGNEATPANVNVTVLIAMPNASTMVPSNPSSKPVPGSRVQTLQAQEGVAHGPEASKMARHASIQSKRSARSIRSVRTTASARSVASARRSAFFGPDYDATLDPSNDKDDKNKNKMRVELVDAETTGRLSDAGSSSEEEAHDKDDEDEDENPEMEEALPELMFGTASVPIYTLQSASSSKGAPSRHGSGVYTGGFTYSPRSHPTRNDLLALLARAEEIRENKPVPPLTIPDTAERSTSDQPISGNLSRQPSAQLPQRATSPVGNSSTPARSILGSLRSHSHPLAATPPPITSSPPPADVPFNSLQPPANPARSPSGGRIDAPAVSTLHTSQSNLVVPAISTSPIHNPWNSSPAASPNAATPQATSGLPPSSSAGAAVSDLRVVEEEEPPAVETDAFTSLPPLARPTPKQAQPKPDSDLDWLGSLRSP